MIAVCHSAEVAFFFSNKIITILDRHIIVPKKKKATEKMEIEGVVCLVSRFRRAAQPPGNGLGITVKRASTGTEEILRKGFGVSLEKL